MDCEGYMTFLPNANAVVSSSLHRFSRRSISHLGSARAELIVGLKSLEGRRGVALADCRGDEFEAREADKVLHDGHLVSNLGRDVVRLGSTNDRGLRRAWGKLDCRCSVKGVAQLLRFSPNLTCM